VKYLLEDGVVIPDCVQERKTFVQGELVGDDSDESWEEGIDSENKENDPLAHTCERSFPEVDRAIQSAIDDFGSVFPKLNWSAPRDATWISADSTLRCESVEEVYLLLKASDFIMHDLTMAFDSCEDRLESRPPQFDLALRKWKHISTSTEFRCFVQDKRLIGACQRDHCNYFPFMRSYIETARSQIDNFFTESIRNVFSLQNYIFDVYIDGRTRVWLVDINPFSVVTDPLLFDWEDLAQLHSDTSSSPETSDVTAAPWPIRFVENPTQIRPSLSMTTRFPRDLIDLSNADVIRDFARAQSNGELN